MYYRWLSCAAVLLFFGASAVQASTTKTVEMGEYQNAVVQDWGNPHRNKTVASRPLAVGGKVFQRGLGTHAGSVLKLNLDGQVQKFRATVGCDDETSPLLGSIQFQIVADGKTVWDSGLMRTGDAGKTCDVALAGVKALELKVTSWDDGNTYDHADWCEAVFEYTGAKPAPMILPKEAPYILTPKLPKSPLLNHAPVFGVRPGRPFLYRIPCTGERPMKFHAEGLPDGLKLNSATGIISGVAGAAGTYPVKLKASNKSGHVTGEMKIVVGDKIALTPPMGWNSWNCFASQVSAEKVRQAADALIRSGLADVGYAYVNIDDFWENRPIEKKDKTLMGPRRDDKGFVVTNKRFPDMKGLYDYIHGLGLKGGIYSGPGPLTCGSCTASFDHEYLDAQQYAEWGVDYLKYDWCSYKPDMETSRVREIDWDKTALKSISDKFPKDTKAVRPYALMGHALSTVNRDIVYSLCQYGMGDVWKWGADVGGNAWRTTGDIDDNWANMRKIWESQVELYPYSGPGRWNDPDMLVVGALGWGKVRPNRMTPSEQYSHFSAWCLLNSPLLLGCDLTALDDFTRNILMNREIIAVNQDELGKQARRVKYEKDVYEIWQKEMADGSTVLGIFNISNAFEPFHRDVKFAWKDLGLDKPAQVRDLWRQKDITDLPADGTFTVAKLPRHGVMMLRVRK